MIDHASCARHTTNISRCVRVLPMWTTTTHHHKAASQWQMRTHRNICNVVQVVLSNAHPGVYTRSRSPLGAAGTWSSVVPHTEYRGRDTSQPTVAFGVPWPTSSEGLCVFRGMNATGVGTPWLLIRRCAPGITTFGLINAMLQPDGVVTLGLSPMSRRRKYLCFHCYNGYSLSFFV